MYDSAYYSATFEGRTGLVPANFVQEMALPDHGAQQRLFNQVSGRTCQILCEYVSEWCVSSHSESLS